VKLYRICREYNASIRHTDTTSRSFYACMRFNDFSEDTLLRVKEFIRSIDKVSSYCRVLVTAIIPHETSPHTEVTLGHGCPKNIENHLRKVCVKYVKGTHEGRGLLRVSNGVMFIVCRRRATRILPIRENADTYLLMSPPTPARFACNDVSELEKILKQLKDAVSLLRQIIHSSTTG